VAVEERRECREANSSRAPDSGKEEEKEEEEEDTHSSLPLPTWATKSRGSTTCRSSMAMEATAKGVIEPPPLLLLSPNPPPPLLMVGGADHTRASREAQAFAKPRAFFRKVYAEKRVRGEVPPTPLPLCDSHSPMKVRRRSPRRRAPLTWGKNVGKEACREATMDAV
jgi:hypothetical protein